MLQSADGFDHSSPVPAYQRWLAVAGVVATVAFVALLFSDRSRVHTGRWLVLALLLGTVGVAPWWQRLTTIDVTAAGFQRASYSGIWLDVYVYNATGAPVAIGVGAGAPVRARTVRPHQRVPLKWPRTRFGTTTLTITSPLPPRARGTTTVTREEPPDTPTV